MEKLRHLLFLSVLAFTGGLLLAASVFGGPFQPQLEPHANAAGSQLQVQVGPPPDVCPNIAGAQATVPPGMIINESGDCVTPPPDVCPNIPGPQASVPAGMVVDTNGDCVTPPPPDVCPNLPGYQSAIPAGYYQDADGNCQPQTTPPQDVCPNITGTQATVPEGMITDTDGNCVTPPPDACPNITGTQTAVPDGMQKDVDGNCYTPAVQPEPQKPQPTGSGTTRTPVKNVPAFLAPVVQPIVDLIPEDVKQVIKQVPPEVARSFPYYIFGVLGAAALTMLLLALRESVASRHLVFLLKREKDIAEEKDNFLALTSHYLLTPITIMHNGIEVIASMNEATTEAMKPLSDAVENLKIKIGYVLADVESNKALKGIKAPEVPQAQTELLKSPYFWIPVIFAGIVILVANFLLSVVGEVDLGITNMWAQFIVFGAVSFVLYSALRNRHLRRLERVKAEQLVNHERTIDTARNAFIQQTTDALRTGLQAVETQRSIIETAPSARFFNEGYQRFTSILAKFTLLGSIESGASGSLVEFNIHDAVEDSLSLHQSQVIDKKLSVKNLVDNVTITQNRVLFGFVLNSVIDNAIKFSKEGGEIIVNTKPGKKMVDITVSDTGIGIENDKLSQLFKPFSRAGSAIQFDYEGMGFSLFLGKIIMDHLGGDITASSSKDKGTTVELKAVATNPSASQIIGSATAPQN